MPVLRSMQQAADKVSWCLFSEPGARLPVAHILSLLAPGEKRAGFRWIDRGRNISFEYLLGRLNEYDLGELQFRLEVLKEEKFIVSFSTSLLFLYSIYSHKLFFSCIQQ